eukprot:189264-Chlamydomonas_euryale.AAC.5
MCLKPAKEGGMSSWASSIAAYNRMLSTHPHLAQLLCEPIWHLDRKGEVPEGKKPHFMIPIVNRQDDHLSVYLNDSYYQLAQRHADVPRMTEEQKEASVGRRCGMRWSWWRACAISTPTDGWMDGWMDGGRDRKEKVEILRSTGVPAHAT